MILPIPLYMYRVAQKSKPLPNDQRIVLNRKKSLSVRRDLFAKFKYESSTVIVFVGIRYSMCDLLSDLNNYARRANIAICVI